MSRGCVVAPAGRCLPAGGVVGTVSVGARLTRAVDHDISFSTQSGPALRVRSLMLTASPLPVFAQVYPADAPASVLAGAAVLNACASCDVGRDVGSTGIAKGSSGTLAIKGRPRPASIPIAGRDFDTGGVVPLTVTLSAGADSVAFGNAPDIVAVDVAPLAPY